MAEVKKVILKKFKHALNDYSCQELNLDARTIQWLNERYYCFFSNETTKYLKDESGHWENVMTNNPDDEELRIRADEFGAVWVELPFDHVFKPAAIPNLRIGVNSELFSKKD